VSHVVERVSGNTVEFEMNSLVPGAHYTVGVHSLKEAQKSDSAVTEFTTGRLIYTQSVCVCMYVCMYVSMYIYIYIHIYILYIIYMFYIYIFIYTVYYRYLKNI